MKTKKLLFLTAIFMVLTSTFAVAQGRGTCTSGATNAYIEIDGTKTDDFSDAVSKNYTVGIGAIVKVGIAPTYLNWGEITDFTIAVSLNGAPQYTIHKADMVDDKGIYGQRWQPTLSGGLFANANDVITAVMTVTPAATGTAQGCTEPWTYTYNLTVASDCISNPIPYYKDPILSWTNKLTTDYSFDVSLNPNTKIIVGINPSSGTLSWTGSNGFTGTAQEFEFDPQITVGGGTCTLIGEYTAACGKVTTYTYNFSAPTVCIPVTETITPYYLYGSNWSDGTSGDISINGGDTIKFGPNPYDNHDNNGKTYTYLWTGAGAADLSSTTVREPTFNDTHGVSVLLTATMTYNDGCNAAATASYTYKIIVDNKPLAVDKFDQGGFKMYPNPADNVLNIVFNGDVNVSITNVTGQQVLSPRSISKQGSIDVSSLSAGIYFLKADSNGESIVRKFVKN